MLQSNERETEILLGNKQLLGIFFVGAVLLGIAFTGGYMVGRGPGSKKAIANAESAAAMTGTQPAVGQVGETHSVPPNDASLSSTAGVDASPAKKSAEDLLGSRRKKNSKTQAAGNELVPTSAPKPDGFTPQSGQEFLQVTAVPRDHALAVASVLRRKGFRAHAVAKPGEANMYRVIVGPIRNAGELSSTRDSLRKTGFNQVLVQHYQ